MIKELFFNWHKNKEKEMWMDPPNGLWKSVMTNDIIIIDYDGDELIQLEKQEKISIKERWNDLIKEANINLAEEDKAASQIIGLIKGYNIRKR